MGPCFCKKFVFFRFYILTRGWGWCQCSPTCPLLSHVLLRPQPCLHRRPSKIWICLFACISDKSLPAVHLLSITPLSTTPPCPPVPFCCRRVRNWIRDRFPTLCVITNDGVVEIAITIHSLSTPTLHFLPPPSTFFISCNPNTLISSFTLHSKQWVI